MHLISPVVIDPIQHLKVDHLGNRNPRLHTDEVLIALSISAATNPMAEFAMAGVLDLVEWVLFDGNTFDVYQGALDRQFRGGTF